MRVARGFTLIELLVVLVIISLLVAMAAAITRALGSGQKRSLTATRMQSIDAALVQFVSLQKRLPCPADGTIVDPANASFGVEFNRAAAGCPDPPDERNGVLPWRTLGIAEADALDGWDRRFTYRVARNLAADNALDMSMCDPASPNPPNDPTVAVAVCNPACTAAAISSCTPPQSFLIGKGLQVRKADGLAVIMDPASLPPTGAAYVLISHGETGGGALTNAGVLVVRDGDGVQEQRNYVNQIVVGYYVADDPLETPHFDDMVSRPSLANVINRAALGPRSH